MPEPVKTGAPILGVIFLLLPVFKFMNGDGWVVWAILGFLFGGLRIFASNRSGGLAHEPSAIHLWDARACSLIGTASSPTCTAIRTGA